MGLSLPSGNRGWLSAGYNAHLSLTSAVSHRVRLSDSCPGNTPPLAQPVCDRCLWAAQQAAQLPRRLLSVRLDRLLALPAEGDGVTGRKDAQFPNLFGLQRTARRGSASRAAHRGPPELAILAWLLAFALAWGMVFLPLHLMLYPFPNITHILNRGG